MERSRITPRLRPRPYDLRRKVLLKNFFREQMTYIPHIQSAAESSLAVIVSSDSDSNENETNSNGNEGNVLTPKNVQDNIVSTVAVLEPAPSTSNCNEKENSNNLESSPSEILSSSGEMKERPSTKFSRLSRIIETIDSRLPKRNWRKGITKAKHELRSNKGGQKPVGLKKIKDAESSTKIKAKSFFEIFKSRRNKKRIKTVISKKTNFFGSRNLSPNRSNCDLNVATTSTQSVQTEISWSPDHYESIEQSNRSLLEENRLLSESLSNIISSADFRSGNLGNSRCTDSYTDNIDKSVTHFRAEKKPSTITECGGSNSQPDFSRTRILRSKSMYDRSEKRNFASSRLRTRSMNCKYNKRPSNTDSYIRNKPYFNEQKHHRGNSIASPIPSRAKTKPSIESVNALPLYNTNTKSLLQTLPIKSGKGITRRSSMPEKTYYWNNKTRPVRSSSMRENNRYSYVSEHEFPHPNQSSRHRSNQPPHHRRSNTFNGYYSVPFQDLPADAFY